MVTVTDRAASVLKAAKNRARSTARSWSPHRAGAMPDDSGKPTLAIGFAISDDPAPADEELEQNGLRIFVQDTLVEPLDGRTLNVRERRRWARTDLSLAVRATAC